MIHLIRDYYLNVDRQSGGCYIVGKAQSCVSERVLLSRTRYYTTLSVALASTAEIALRDAIAAGDVQTLQQTVQESALYCAGVRMQRKRFGNIGKIWLYYHIPFRRNRDK